MPALRTRDTQQRSLEVTTDAPAPPTLAIISPTPRAFTFPATHTLSDSPYSSPASSPFEPDTRTLPLTCPSPTSDHPARCLTPATSVSAFDPSPASPVSPASHKRRKSSTGSIPSDAERRPRRGDEDYIKRPENAFILFRRKCCEDRQAAADDASAAASSTSSASPATKKQRQADLSKTISQQWKSLAPEEKQRWEQLAKQRKKEHEAMYPNYVYRPQRSKDKEAKAKAKKAAASASSPTAKKQDDADTVSFVIPMPAPRHHGRSASAPTPPPYQTIQIPNVYMTPSCPTSPSLLPMISRRQSHPHYDAGFDFVPTGEGLMPPPVPFGQGSFEASLQSSEFLRGMYNMSAAPAPQTRMSAPSLHPLSLHHQYSSHQQQPSLVSPASSSPSSPCTGPFTPTSATMLATAFAHLDTSASPSSASASAHPHPHHEAYGADVNTAPVYEERYDEPGYDEVGYMRLSLGAPMIDTSAFSMMGLPLAFDAPSSSSSSSSSSACASSAAAPATSASCADHINMADECALPELAAYAWEASSLWPAESALYAGDFDIHAIPPIELGLPRFADEVAAGKFSGGGAGAGAGGGGGCGMEGGVGEMGDMGECGGMGDMGMGEMGLGLGDGAETKYAECGVWRERVQGDGEGAREDMNMNMNMEMEMEMEMDAAAVAVGAAPGHAF